MEFPDPYNTHLHHFTYTIHQQNNLTNSQLPYTTQANTKSKIPCAVSVRILPPH